MATVSNWIDHLSAAEVQGAIYPGVGTEGILVIALLVIWIGWHVLQNNAESKSLEQLAKKRHGANDHKSNITEW
jgi:type VI protein secretion system component VasF